MKSLIGTGVALVTPFKNGEVDYKSLQQVIEHTIEGGVEYLVSLGTTGETPTLSRKEQFEVLNFTIEIINGRVPLVAGFGGSDTRKIIQKIKDFHFEGVDAILSSSPNYNKPTQEGIFRHYMAIAEATPKPIIIYNVPARTSRNIKATTTLRLAHASERFVAIKEASGNLMQCMNIQREKPNDFLLLSGDDALALPMLSVGGQGVISVIANAYPRQFSDMIRAGLSNDYSKARTLHYQLLEMMRLIFVDGNPAGVKAALAQQGLCKDEVRLPLVRATKSTIQAIGQENAKLLGIL